MQKIRFVLSAIHFLIYTFFVFTKSLQNLFLPLIFSPAKARIGCISGTINPFKTNTPKKLSGALYIQLWRQCMSKV